MQYKEEGIQNLQATMDQYRDKCFYLEQDLSVKMKENEEMKKELEKYQVDYLTGKGD
jgi:hypothetical protein